MGRDWDAPTELCMLFAELTDAQENRSMRSLLTVIATWLLMGSVPVTTAAQMTSFHVSRSGSDTNPGTAAAPFATLTRARDAIRLARKTGKLGDGPVVVNIRGGAHRITETLTLTKEDSGTEKAPVIWQAAEVGGPRIRPVEGRQGRGDHQRVPRSERGDS